MNKKLRQKILKHFEEGRKKSESLKKVWKDKKIKYTAKNNKA